MAPAMPVFGEPIHCRSSPEGVVRHTDAQWPSLGKSRRTSPQLARTTPQVSSNLTSVERIPQPLLRLAKRRRPPCRPSPFLRPQSFPLFLLDLSSTPSSDNLTTSSPPSSEPIAHRFLQLYVFSFLFTIFFSSFRSLYTFSAHRSSSLFNLRSTFP